LLRVAKNRCIDRLRRKHRQMEALPEETPCERAENTPEGFLAKANLSDCGGSTAGTAKEPGGINGFTAVERCRGSECAGLV